MTKVTICGSMAFIVKMRGLAAELESMGCVGLLPADGEADYKAMDLEAQIVAKGGFIDDHLAKIRGSDAVLIANYEKRGVAGYVGANTLMEIAFAYVLGKQIFILHELGKQDCQIEVLGMRPRIVAGDLSLVVGGI